MPTTVLVLVDGRVAFGSHDDAYHVDGALRARAMEYPALCVSRWNREALSRWQWRWLDDPNNLALAGWQDVAPIFAQAPPTRPMVVAHEEMLALDHDGTGKLLGALQDRLQLPHDMFLPGYEDSLGVKWNDLKATDGSPARVYLLSSMQRFGLFAVREVEGQWVFAGTYDIWSKYADPDIRTLEDDATIFELSSISTGGTGTWTGAAAWCQIDERGLQVVHDWHTGGQEFYGGAPFNYEYTTARPLQGSDGRGAFIDQTLTLTITNANVSWDDPRCDPADAIAVNDLVDVFERTGRARYRWNTAAHRFTLSVNESDWTAEQADGWFYDDTVFLTQNFDTLVNLATGEDAAKRAWVRLVLTRLVITQSEDSTERTRLMRAIDKRANR